jgi:imidazolonepropionase-like amidohydrolase
VCCPASRAQDQPLVIRAGIVIDGAGHALHDTAIVVQGGKILRVGPQSQSPANAAVLDLTRYTVLPGWIDTHVHIGGHFNAEGRADTGGESPQQAAYAAAGNAWATLMAGFTTVQSLGATEDKPLRDAVEAGQVPGPRILTALRPISDGRLTPEQLRAWVDEQKANGADVVKIFASRSIREGGGQTMSDEQLAAACSQASRQGLRSVVHAYKTAIRSGVLAGCTTIEHGTFATDADLKLMAEHGTWFDPQVRLVIQNYLDHKQNFLGIGNYTEEGFKQMEAALPLNADLFRRALATPNLKIIFGTDAVAGAHGRNAEEFIYRVKDAGESPMHAMTAATSLAAESLGLSAQIGRIAAGYQADIIALEGNPLDDITAVRHVVFVMKAGKIIKNEAGIRNAVPSATARK